MTAFTTEETLEAKAAYEAYMNTHGHEVKCYRADNGRFTDNDFVASIKEANQTLTLCGVGAHHQNGIAEARIKILSLGCRTLLLHAKRHWKEATTTMLWPFAFKEIISRENEL